jgi:hypothetical protein
VCPAREDHRRAGQAARPTWNDASLWWGEAPDELGRHWKKVLLLARIHPLAWRLGIRQILAFSIQPLALTAFRLFHHL